VHRLTAFVITVAAVVLLGACSAQTGATAGSSSMTGPQVLQFSAKTVDGVDFSGQSLAGKPAVLWFWAPWCPTCQAEAPAVAKAAQTHPSLTFLGVAARDQVPAMKHFVATYKMAGFTHLADVDASVWRHFGITEQPAFAFIAADGSAQVVPACYRNRTSTDG
jgi:thiol-disulfide isomerase/thioredoxin